MKNLLILVLTVFSISGFAQQISEKKAQQIAKFFFDGKGLTSSVDSIITQTNSNGDTLYYVINNSSKSSYVIVSANKQLPPILSWSATSQYLVFPQLTLMVNDYISGLIKASEKYSDAKKAEIDKEWKSLNKKYKEPKIGVWPATGTTTTEGWIETRWTQSSPYNMMCPRDLVSNAASYAGCPAIVMGQVLNCLKTTNNARFNDNDDYQHNYDGRVYSIDDDASSLGFPTFPALNDMLDSIDIIYATESEITPRLAAALVFACGTACTQVYTSQGSGTFAVIQAYEAYQRFGFDNCELHETADSAMYSTLISNMKQGYPAHLAVVDEEWSTGHNVAVDGFREDGYFHINFGWGGASDGWWRVPDTSFPYSMGVLEGIILNIIPNNTSSTNNIIEQDFSIYPNPAHDSILIKPIQKDETEYAIYTINGMLLKSGQFNETIDISDLSSGTYILKIKTDKKSKSCKFVVM